MRFKKVKKLLVSVVTSIMLLSNSNLIVEGANNSDLLYANAFNAVQACTISNTQQGINSARSAIKALKGTSAAWAIGEFSKQTDVVQQKLFEEFMGLLFEKNNVPKPSITQEEVNRARDLVISFDTYDGNKPYTAAWSSAVDKYQQKLMQEAMDLVVNAENTINKEDIEKGKKAVESLLTAENNQGVITFANELAARIKVIDDKYQKLIRDEAIKLVTNAEISKKKEDIEKAKIAINKLLLEENNQESKELGNELLKRLNNIQIVDVDSQMKEIETLVQYAEKTKKQIDIDKAKEELNKLLEKDKSEKVLEFYNKSMARLNVIVPDDGNITWKIGGRAGHNWVSTGASSILDEVTENRKVFGSTFNYLKPFVDLVDCTPYDNPPKQMDDLKYGVDKANSNNVDFYFSVHMNKAYNTLQNSAIGSEVWVYDRNSKVAIEKANAILKNLEKLGFKNRGIKYSTSLFELDNTNCESIIVECFFLESIVDCNLYNQVGFDKIGQAIANGIDKRVPFTVN